MALRPVRTDRLPLSLCSSQPADELGSKEEADEKRGRARCSRPEADVTDEVEDARKAELFGDHVEHGIPLTIRSTSLESPTELDALTRTASPARTICIKD